MRVLDAGVGEVGDDAVAGSVESSTSLIVPWPKSPDWTGARERLQRRRGLLAVRRVTQREGHRLPTGAQPAIADALLAQRLADIAFKRLQPVGDEAVAVDLEQQVRAAAQVQPERRAAASAAMTARTPPSRRRRSSGVQARKPAMTTNRMIAIFQRGK